MVLFIQILYWTTLFVWSAVVTYVIVFVFFPEKGHHDEPHDTSNTPKFARHRFQQLPGNAELSVNDIVTALQHLPKKGGEEEAPADEHIEHAPEEVSEISEEEHAEEH